MKNVNTVEMRNVNGGARCPGCNKNCAWGTLWLHKIFCAKYQALKAKKALDKMWG